MTINKNTIISNWGVTQKPVLLLEQFMTYIARQAIQTKNSEGKICFMYPPNEYWKPPGASLIAQLVKNLLQCRRPWFNFWVRKFSWRRDRLPTPVFSGFPGGSDGKKKKSTHSVGDLGSTPGLGRSPGEGIGYPLLYSGLENSMDSIAHGITKSQTQQSDFRFH